MSSGAVDEERVFGEIKRLCLSGLDETSLVREVISRLRHAVPIDAYLAPRIDPLSGLLTGTVSEGAEQVARPRFFLEHVYFEDEVLEFNWMARNRHPVACSPKPRRVNSIVPCIGGSCTALQASGMRRAASSP